MDAAAELGRNPVSTRFSLGMEMSRLARDGTAEPVSRDQILGRKRGQEKISFPVELTTSRIGNLTRLTITLAICDDHTYIHTYDPVSRRRCLTTEGSFSCKLVPQDKTNSYARVSKISMPFDTYLSLVPM